MKEYYQPITYLMNCGSLDKKSLMKYLKKIIKYLLHVKSWAILDDDESDVKCLYKKRREFYEAIRNEEFKQKIKHIQSGSVFNLRENNIFIHKTEYQEKQKYILFELDENSETNDISQIYFKLKISKVNLNYFFHFLAIYLIILILK